MNFLHISDLHFGKMGYTTGRAKSNIEDILDVLETAGLSKIHSVFITGDLIYAKNDADRQESNLCELSRYINYIVQMLKVDKDNLFIVPGNHDIKRTDERLENCKKVKSEYDLEYGISDETYNMLRKGFEEFLKLHLDICNRDYSLKPHLDICSTFNVLSLNTALVSCQDQEDRSLIIDVECIRRELEKSDKTKPTIAIGHHPVESMHTRESQMLQSLFMSHNVQIYLCGHEHQMICNIISPESNDLKKLYQFKCGTLMPRHLDKSETDMLIYAGYIDHNYIGHVLPIKWDKRFERWMPDTGISYHRDKELDGLIYINKNRKEVEREKCMKFVDEFMQVLDKYGDIIRGDTLDSLMKEHGCNSPKKLAQAKEELVRRKKIAKNGKEIFEINK